MMKKLIQPLLLGLLAGLALSAQADGAVPHPALRFMMTGGLTAGGDKVAKVTYDDGGTTNVRAGEVMTVGAGAIWQPEDSDFSIQATVNYHFSGVFAKNGSVKFDRYPLELMGFYKIDQKWRVGAGVRYVLSPSYTQDIDNQSSSSVDFKDTVGGVVEVGYFFSPQALLNLRYVSEKYELKNTGPYKLPKVDGSHVGVTGTYIF